MPHFAHHFEENYLKALYKLSSQEGRKVNNIALAKTLGLNPATVLEMVRKLSEKKLVQVQADKSLALTEKGKKKALLVIRRHRLWEVFLVEKLQYSWNEVHELAEQLEHIDSDDLVDRLEVFLGNPPYDPHGDPIPDRQGRIKENRTVPLSSGIKGKSYTVVSFAETGDDFLDYLGKLQLLPGSLLRITDQHPFDQSFTITLQKRSFQISEKVAQNIRVKPAS
ncbi:MAG TPA: metal-dependent transcriptional regulator [Chitinophagaceae bacterium]|jgi:DtxR family Mn-dependent transcriptional regulator|nr:metal-dependent transcriptional regulator [Chitinophagaceae bacterium]